VERREFRNLALLLWADCRDRTQAAVR
jgi:hypothetical protein